MLPVGVGIELPHARPLTSEVPPVLRAPGVFKPIPEPESQPACLLSIRPCAEFPTPEEVRLLARGHLVVEVPWFSAARREVAQQGILRAAQRECDFPRAR